MRIVADENCDRMIVVALREAGYDVLSIRESEKGQDDSYIFDLARIENRVILTGDLDFGHMCEHRFPHLSSCGLTASIVTHASDEYLRL